MAITHIPRTITAMAKGYMKRSLSRLSESEKSIVGLGFRQPPHVYSSRAGLLDIDVLLHMNNASYLTHAELARWEWETFGGVWLESQFVITASMIRFRKEIIPFKGFEIESRLGAIDDKHFWVYQTFHYAGQSDTSNGSRIIGSNRPKSPKRGKVLAQLITQGVMVKGDNITDPSLWAEKIDQIANTEEDIVGDLKSHNEPTFLFDEKRTQFKNLLESLRKSSAVHDKINQ